VFIRVIPLNFIWKNVLLSFMSVIFGLFYRDGKPVSDELETMYSGMTHFPQERYSSVVQGNCGFGHILTYNTPEAVNESMPRWVEAARLLFVAEGRLDNRDELFEAFDIPAGERDEMPDGDLMLNAYLKWGENCVDKLMGKWSLAAFHTNEQRLFIARDKWDYSNIEYYADEKVFAFATSEKGLLPLPFIKKEIDELMIARLLVVWPGDFDKSYIKGLKHLLPSHTLSVTREKAELRRYWNYADIRVREGLKLEDYVEDLLDSFNKAVACRLRSYKPVAATLSGGMDSSSVCVIAAEQLAKQGKRLQTYSHVPQFPPSNTLSEHQFGDERPFIEAVVEAASTIDPMFLNSAGISPLEGIKEAIGLCGRPFHGACNAYWLVDIYMTAANENYGTILKGEFGNATISWNGVEDALPASEIFKRYGIKGLTKKKLLKPILYGSTPFASIYKNMTFGKRPWDSISYCTKTFEDSLDLAKRIKSSGFDPTFRRHYPDPKKQAVRIFDFNVSRLSLGSNIGCETGLELRDPTGDTRVIESALAIPHEMFFGEMDKWVLRTMMKGRLPDKIRLNTKKGKQSSDIPARLYAHREEMDRIFAEMEASGFGRIVDMERIQAEWKNLKADCDNYPVNQAAHFLRPVAAFVMYQMNGINSF
jgi:asparagine synthase (glutamine-hydrolysing)